MNETEEASAGVKPIFAKFRRHSVPGDHIPPVEASFTA